MAKIKLVNRDGSHKSSAKKTKSKWSGTGVGKNGNLHPELGGMWKKGQTGNPRGRKKGTPNFATVIERILDGDSGEEDHDVGIRLTRRELMILKACRRAIYDGDNKALELLMDRVEGKPMQKTQVSADVSQTQVYLPDNKRE